MSAEELRVLLVEDSEMVAELVTIWLTECDDPPLAVVRVTTLHDALETLGAGEFDAMLLDLSLPDSAGLSTVSRAVAHSPGVPVVVLTASSDQDQARGAVAAGAQDYLFKMHMNGETLQRALIYAIERHRRASEANPRERGWVAEEIQRVQDIASVSWPTGEGDAGALSHTNPDAFERLSNEYNAVLSRLVGAIGDDEAYEPADDLRRIADLIKDEWGGPGDVIALHAEALRTGLTQAAVEELKAHPEVTRGLGLKFMGHLVAAYRGAAMTRRARSRTRTHRH